MSVESTRLLYLAVYFFTTLFAFLSQKNKHGKISFKGIWLFFAFLMHWIVVSFTNTGVDYDHYYHNILYADSSVFLQVEPLFNGLGYVLNLLFKSPHISIFFIKTLSVCILYYSFYRIRYKTNLGIAVLAYNAFIFIQSMLVIAQHLALVLWFCSLVFLLEEKHLKSILLALCSCLIHSSFFIVLLMYPIYFLYKRKGKRMGAFIIMAGVIAIFVVRYAVSAVLSYALETFAFFSHYTQYDLINEYSGTGLGQIIFMLPVIFFVYKLYRSDNSNDLKNITVLYILFAICCAMVGYLIDVFARMNIDFYGLYALLIPMYIISLNEGRNKSYNFIWILYLLFRAYFIFKANMNPNAGGQLYSYMFFNPFS